MTSGQQAAVRQLEDVAALRGGAFKLLSLIRLGDSPRAWVRAEIDVVCEHYARAPNGVPLEPRERLLLLIPPGFPFAYPYVVAPHRRWAGYPHVMRDQTLCLYQAPASEWDPSDGMFGFLQRLDDWLRLAALDELDPLGAPLHPPLTYMMDGTTAPPIILRADAPAVGDDPWFGFAVLDRMEDAKRLDLTGWIPLTFDGVPTNVAAVVLLTEPMPPLYPQRVRDVIDELEKRGLSRRRLLLLLKIAAYFNGDKMPLYFVIGAPMRGIRGSGDLRQHLEVWRLNETVADALRLVLSTTGESAKLQEIGAELEKAVLEWADAAEVDWCNAIEARPQIVVARDLEAPTAWFRDRVVVVWGCGALGGRVAEFLMRAGVRRLILRDKSAVHPGILVRQPFSDADIGRNKAEALAEQLRKIRPGVDVMALRDDLLHVLDRADWWDEADVVIDTTGSEAVLSKLELRRKGAGDQGPAIAAMAIGHKAQNGFVVVAGGQYTGGPCDLSRRGKIWACGRPDLAHFVDEFWPTERRKRFQPEPGCSEPTFVGGAADVAVLAGFLLNGAADALRNGGGSGRACFVALPRLDGEALSVATASWDRDTVVNDPHAGYEIRISYEAFKELRAWIRRSARTVGPGTETGGYLFGERDEATKILWITEISGPPRDSEASPESFVCGVDGVEALIAEKRRRTRDSVRLVGVWHAHPDSAPVPSSTDLHGIACVIEDSGAPSARALMMIVGNTTSGLATIGTYDFSRDDVERIARGRFRRVCELSVVPPRPELEKRVGLALSGGGARAIAFHLGCLRALHDRGILGQVAVISSVSGGSVIGALYAYSDSPFEDFDARVVTLLRRGLLRGMGQAARRPRWLGRTAGTVLTAGIAAKAADAMRLLAGRASRISRMRSWSLVQRLKTIQPPLPRRSSRTDLLEATLRDEVFGVRTLTSARRDNIDIIVNACELRSGSAFRFGSRESGCWRYGRVARNEAIDVAHAVAASAAYPALLPALDRAMTFVDGKGTETTRRVLLTDGGIFDNLGTSCLEPGRDESISTNVFHPPYIIACDAGPGLFAADVVPYWWPTRMVRAFDSVFRKAGNAAYDRLHRLRGSGAIRGFVHAYLGQRDETLPYRPADLVPRDAVMGYPTDFAPMTEDDIRLLSMRGEQLTRLLIEYYCPEL